LPDSPYDEKYLNILKEIVLSLVDKDKVTVFLFGSRVHGRHGPRADADIGLLSDEKLTESVFHRIRNAIDSSIVPWEVDIVDFTKVDSAFKREAMQDIIVWNNPRTSKSDSEP
jgi:predicted nucleotidyltransferase